MPTPGVDEEKRETLRRFAAFGSLPLAGFAGSEDHDSGSLTRDAISGYLAETPGAHFSKLRDDLQLGTGEAQHHLRRLLDADVVESHRDGDYRRFFIADRFDTHEKQTVGYLRRETPRAMLITALRDPGTTPAALAESVGVSRATVSTWTSRLAEDAIIARDGGYQLTDPELVLVLLVRYADSFGADAQAVAGDAPSLIDYAP
ncbi:MAG: winged helix-turn-helix transcriptional regulator [Halobacteriaceae archaeon]